MRSLKRTPTQAICVIILSRSLHPHNYRMSRKSIWNNDLFLKLIKSNHWVYLAIFEWRIEMSKLIKDILSLDEKIILLTNAMYEDNNIIIAWEPINR